MGSGDLGCEKPSQNSTGGWYLFGALTGERAPLQTSAEQEAGTCSGTGGWHLLRRLLGRPYSGPSRAHAISTWAIGASFSENAASIAIRLHHAGTLLSKPNTTWSFSPLLLLTTRSRSTPLLVSSKRLSPRSLPSP